MDSLVVGLLLWAVFGTTQRTAVICGVAFGVLSGVAAGIVWRRFANPSQEEVALYADLTMLARLGQALVRARAVLLAAQTPPRQRLGL